MGLVLSHCNLGLSTSLRPWLFSTGMRGLWPERFCKPMRKVLYLFAAQAIANISNLMIWCCDSALLRKREPACMSTHWPVADCCCRMNPKPCLLASVHRWVGWETLKKLALGDRCCLAVISNMSWSTVQLNSFFVLNNRCNGSNRVAILSVLVDSWLVSLKKDCRSVHEDGMGNFVMSSVTVESIWYPSEDRVSPANVTCLCISAWPWWLLMASSFVLRLAPNYEQGPVFL